MKHSKIPYTLILVQNQAIFFVYSAKEQWQNKRINGEISNRVSNHHDLTLLLKNLNDHINQANKLAEIELNILYATQHQDLLLGLPQKLAELQCQHWQILRWEPIEQRALNIKNTTHSTHPDWLAQILLPTLDQSLNYHDEAWRLERERAYALHEQNMENLHADRQQLENKIIQLKQQIQAMHLPDMEQLLVFLPILYRNFWNNIKPSDLALLARTYHIPEVASPFPEPSNHTIIQMKKNLQALPLSQQQRLLDFCHQLPHDLEIRPEMRFFFTEI